MSYWDPFGRPYTPSPSSEPPVGSSPAYQQSSEEHSTWTHDHWTHPTYGNSEAASGSGSHYPQSQGEMYQYHNLPRSETDGQISVSDYTEAVDSSSSDSRYRSPHHGPFMALAEQEGADVSLEDLVALYNQGRAEDDELPLGTAKRWAADHNKLNPDKRIGAGPRYNAGLEQEFLAFAMRFDDSTDFKHVVANWNERSPSQVHYNTALRWRAKYKIAHPEAVIKGRKTYSKSYILDFLNFADPLLPTTDKPRIVVAWNRTQPADKQVIESTALSWFRKAKR